MKDIEPHTSPTQRAPAVLWIAGGLALGLTAGVLMARPRGKSGDTVAGGNALSRSARAALAVAGELGLALAVRAISDAGGDEAAPAGDRATATARPTAPAPSSTAEIAVNAATKHFPGLHPGLSRAAGLLASLWGQGNNR